MAGLDKRFPVDFSQLVASASSSGTLVLLADDGSQTGYVTLQDIIALVVSQMSGTVNGSGITFSLDGNGHLISHNNGTTTDLGSVVGSSGTPGTNGNDGVSVSSATINASGHLLFTLSNGSTLDAGDLSAGALALTNGKVVQALGFTPYDAANPAGYVTGADVQSAIDDAPAKEVAGTGYTVTSGASYQMQPTDYKVGVNKATGSATEIKLPSSPKLWRTYDVSDLKGDAGANPITVTFNGATIIVIANNGWSNSMYFNGSQWVMT